MRIPVNEQSVSAPVPAERLPPSPLRRRPLLVRDVCQAHDEMEIHWPSFQFEASGDQTSWEAARYCHAALRSVDQVARLIGLDWVSDHFLAYAGLRWSPRRTRLLFLDRQLSRWLGPDWAEALNSYLVHAGERPARQLEPLGFAWASTVKYASFKDSSAFFVRELAGTYQQISVIGEKHQERTADKWRLRARMSEHLSSDRLNDEAWWTPERRCLLEPMAPAAWWTPKRPRRTQEIVIELGDCPRWSSTLADGQHLARVTVERQQQGVGLFMDLSLSSKRRPIRLFGAMRASQWRVLQPNFPQLRGIVTPVIHPLFQWKPPISRSEQAAGIAQLERAAIRSLYDPRELLTDLINVLKCTGAEQLVDGWSHGKPSGREHAMAMSAKNRLDRLGQQMEAVKDEWEAAIRLATEYTNSFNRLTAESSVRWDHGEPPADLRNEWGVRLLAKADRQLEPVRLDPIAMRSW